MADVRTIDVGVNGSILIRPGENRAGGLEGVEISLRDETGGETTWHYLPLGKLRNLRDALNVYLGE